LLIDYRQHVIAIFTTNCYTIVMNQQPIKRLYRSKNDRVIAGICGGLGEYFKIDPVLIRILAVLLVLGFGSGIIAYLVGWLIIPEAPAEEQK
jgi:phage shock protein C